MEESGRVDPSDDVLDLLQAAQYMRASESTLRYWRHNGTGPRSFRIGRRVKYMRSDLDAFIAASRAADGPH